MKKAIQITYTDKGKEFESFCKLASLSGFEYIAISFSEMKPDSSEQISEHVKRTLEEFSLECVQVDLPHYNIYENSLHFTDDTEKAICNAVRVGGELGARFCVYRPLNSVSSGFITNKSLEDNKRQIEGYLEIAHKYNTIIAIKNMPLIRPVSFYAANFDDLAELVDSLKSDRVGVCWDTGDANLLPYSQRTALRYLGERVVCTSLRDNYKNYHDHKFYYPVLYGKVDWGDVLAGLADIGYDGPLTLETVDSYKQWNKYPDYLIRSFMEYGFVSLDYLETIYNQNRKETTK